MFSVDLSKFYSAVVPVLLVNESVHMDEGTLEMLQSKLFAVQEGGRIAGFVLLGIGAAIMIIFLLAFAVFYYTVIAPKVRALNKEKTQENLYLEVNRSFSEQSQRIFRSGQRFL